MHALVRQAFGRFNEPLEGRIEHMYLDIKGLVTVGIGCLLTPGEAKLLPFEDRGSGVPADAIDIEAEYADLSKRKHLAKAGHRAAYAATRLRLPYDEIDALLHRRLALHEAQIRWRRWEEFPPEAQLAVLSISWAVGPTGLRRFVRFREACEKFDFHAAAEECEISTKDNAGIIERNERNKVLLMQAQKTLKLMRIA
jgi:GH24 family phage-related lysozyme (muramidase)